MVTNVLELNVSPSYVCLILSKAPHNSGKNNGNSLSAAVQPLNQASVFGQSEL